MRKIEINCHFYSLFNMWYIVGAKFPWCRKELFGRFWKQQTLFNQISHDNTTNLPRVRKKVHSVNLKFIVFSSSCLKLTSPKYFPLMYFSNLHKEMNNEKKKFVEWIWTMEGKIFFIFIHAIFHHIHIHCRLWFYGELCMNAKCGK